MEDQIEQHITNEEKYETQINNLIKSVNELQNQVNCTTTEKETVIGDLYAVRELCVRLDQTREELTKKLAEKTTQHEKVLLSVNATYNTLSVLAFSSFLCMLQLHLLYLKQINKIFSLSLESLSQ